MNDSIKSLENKRVIICLGTGGVGKTTLASALSIECAEEGKRVLCLTIDPAKRLAESLGLSWNQKDDVHVELGLADGAARKGSLTIRKLNPRATFDKLIHRYAPEPGVESRLLNNILYRFIASSLAGTRDYMAIEELFALMSQNEYDTIVLDTPPTANAFDFLKAPDQLASLIDSPPLRWFLKLWQHDGALASRLFQKGANLVFSGLARFTGAEFLKRIAEFLGDMNSLFGGFTERAAIVQNALASGDVAYVIVCRPTRAAIADIRLTLDRLEALRLKCSAVFINDAPLERAGVDASLETIKNTLEPCAASLPQGVTKETLAIKLHLIAEQEKHWLEHGVSSMAKVRALVSAETALLAIPTRVRDVSDIHELKNLMQSVVTL